MSKADYYVLNLKAATVFSLTAASMIASPGVLAASTDQVINYADGAQYKGALKDGMRHGIGKIQWANGDRYEGDWKKDQPHGFGIKSYLDSSVYEGDFKQGRQHGKGQFTYPDGTTYKGDWENDTPNGLGTFIFVEAGTYEGAVQLGLPHGQGSFSYSNGDYYEGQWEHGKQEGMGKLNFANGDMLVGTFVDGNAHGSGAITYADGTRYKGNFTNGKPHGDGTCFKPNEQALCSYEYGHQVAYAVIPNYMQEESTLDVEATAVLAPKPAPEIVAVAAPKEEPVTVAAATNTFIGVLEAEKEQLKPNYSADDLNIERSDILFNHNFEQLELARSLRTGTWKKRSSLFNDHLIISTRSGDLELQLKIKVFDGPGTYRIKASDIKAWFNGEALNGLKEFAHTVTIKDIDDQWVAGNINLSFQQKDQYGDFYKVENGVFRLNKKPIYSPSL